MNIFQINTPNVSWLDYVIAFGPLAVILIAVISLYLSHRQTNKSITSANKRTQDEFLLNINFSILDYFGEVLSKSQTYLYSLNALYQIDTGKNITNDVRTKQFLSLSLDSVRLHHYNTKRKLDDDFKSLSIALFRLRLLIVALKGSIIIRQFKEDFIRLVINFIDCYPWNLPKLHKKFMEIEDQREDLTELIKHGEELCEFISHMHDDIYEGFQGLIFPERD